MPQKIQHSTAGAAVIAFLSFPRPTLPPDEPHFSPAAIGLRIPRCGWQAWGIWRLATCRVARLGMDAGGPICMMAGQPQPPSLPVIHAGDYFVAMPIPGLNDAGLLPPGVHDCTLDEVRQRFGVFQTTDRRPKLFDKLQALVQAVWATGLVVEIIIDGSFVTAKPDPNDVDLILVLNRGHDFTAELRPFEYNVLSTRQTRKIYGFDFLVAMQESSVYDEYLAFFAQVRGETSLRKGLLRLRHDQK